MVAFLWLFSTVVGLELVLWLVWAHSGQSTLWAVVCTQAQYDEDYELELRSEWTSPDSESALFSTIRSLALKQAHPALHHEVLYKSAMLLGADICTVWAANTYSADRRVNIPDLGIQMTLHLCSTCAAI